MRRIQKKISLETLTSRVPSVVPAYMDNQLYFFDYKSIKDRQYVHTSNYGMVPLNIVLNKAPKDVVDGQYSVECDGSFVMSFETLQKWYYFFKEYYDLLNNNGHCNRSYTSAREYFYFESNGNYPSDMKYGEDEETYSQLDRDFAEKGGKVKMINGEAVDNGFFKWICENIIPTYYISNTYESFWNRKKLFYPDVISWIGWFEKRLRYENETTYTAATENELEKWDCSSLSGECCDCEEYFKRGGKREYDRMVDWFRNLQEGIATMNDAIFNCLESFIPTMINPIELQTSIDDLGQFSIFSSEYELGVDYRGVARYGDLENTVSGTVVNVDGKSMILSKNKEGFTFDDFYMEKQFDSSAWKDYTDYYINLSENRKKFLIKKFEYYTFDENGNIKFTTEKNYYLARNLLRKQLQKKYPITRREGTIEREDGWVLINEILYPIETSEFGTIFNRLTNRDEIYMVYRDEFTQTPYAIINGEMVYAKFYPYMKNQPPCYYFEQFKSENYSDPSEICGRVENKFNINDYKLFPRTMPNDSSVIKYITVEGAMHQLFEDTKITIDDSEYPVIVGYAYDDENQIMYVKKSDNKAYYNNHFGLKEVINSTVNGNSINISYTDDFQMYKAREITGRTSSKLETLSSLDLLVDDVGNTLECIYIMPKNQNLRPANHQPVADSEMEPIYQVGNVANVSRMKISKTDLDDLREYESGYFVGDIISKMVFYYRDVDGNPIHETMFYEDIYTSLEKINLAQRIKEELKDVYAFEEDISCDITYNLGATLARFENTFCLAEGYFKGVEYTETVRFVKTETQYYLRKPDDEPVPKNLRTPPISYSIWTYVLKQDTERIYSNVYNTEYDVAYANFKSEINLMYEDEDGIIRTTYEEYPDMDKNNGINVFPVFREEYLTGISSLENVNADIYIERGINSAFDKHLKLGEVASLDALESYGLGFFKIRNNE